MQLRAHGTFIGSIRLENKKPQQVPIDSHLHFGASTRVYIIRERPQNKIPSTGLGTDNMLNTEDAEGGLLGLPETEGELDNLTEFNTAHNRRIAAMGGTIVDVPNTVGKRRRRSSHVRFKEEEEIINPEDVDPSIGRFRNLVQTTVIPKKKLRLDANAVGGMQSSLTESITRRLQSGLYDLYSGAHTEPVDESGEAMPSTFTIAEKLGLKLPNLAPDIAELDVPPALAVVPIHHAAAGIDTGVMPAAPPEPKKKIYAKEAWPGKKPTHSFLV